MTVTMSCDIARFEHGAWSATDRGHLLAPVAAQIRAHDREPLGEQRRNISPHQRGLREPVQQHTGRPEPPRDTLILTPPVSTIIVSKPGITCTPVSRPKQTPRRQKRAS